MREEELRHLAKLLDDPSHDVREALRRRITSLDREGMHLLVELAREENTHHEHLRLIIELNAEHLLREFQDIATQSSSETDLERGVFLITRFGHPDVDERYCREELRRIITNANARLRLRDKPLEKIIALNEYLFRDEHFLGNREKYNDPNNSYIDTLIESRKGIPISLAVLYMLVAKQCEVRVEGVNMPGHFLLRCIDTHQELFLDPFNGGMFLTKNDCVRFLRNSGYEPEDIFFEKATVRMILVRMMNNLIGCYEDHPESWRIPWLKYYCDIIDRVNP